MASRIDEVYLKSPVWLQQIAVTVWGAGWYLRRFGGRFKQYVADFHARDGWSHSQFREYQESRLRQVLETASRSPHYREVMRRVGATEQSDPWDTLARMPILSKETLRTRGEDLLTQRPVPRGVTVFKSSGTTGTPTAIYFTRDFHSFNTAFGEARSLNVAGVKYSDRRVMFGVRKVCRFDQDRPPFWRFSQVEDMAYASIYHLSPRYLSHYLEFLRRYRPAVVMGYPSALATVARYALERNDLPAPARCVITTSETVTDRARAAIESAFGCSLFDRYGATEGCVLASQCEHGRYHVSPEVGILEICDRRGLPCPPGVLGEVICTGLQNTLQPLIRYRIGDAARWSARQDCPCGRSMPVVEAIEGRVEDMCYTPDGRAMLRFDTVFKGIDNIREAQVVQERLDRFAVLVVPVEGFSARDVARIRENMQLHVGKVQTRVETVPEIPRSASGKFRAVINALPDEDRNQLGNIRSAA
jgi:phenylacetate-CoA ligase